MNQNSVRQRKCKIKSNKRSYCRFITPYLDFAAGSRICPRMDSFLSCMAAFSASCWEDKESEVGSVWLISTNARNVMNEDFEEIERDW